MHELYEKELSTRTDEQSKYNHTRAAALISGQNEGENVFEGRGLRAVGEENNGEPIYTAAQRELELLGCRATTTLISDQNEDERISDQNEGERISDQNEGESSFARAVKEGLVMAILVYGLWVLIAATLTLIGTALLAFAGTDFGIADFGIAMLASATISADTGTAVVASTVGAGFFDGARVAACSDDDNPLRCPGFGCM